jgi:hypothetical protein
MSDTLDMRVLHAVAAASQDLGQAVGSQGDAVMISIQAPMPSPGQIQLTLQANDEHEEVQMSLLLVVVPSVRRHAVERKLERLNIDYQAQEITFSFDDDGDVRVGTLIKLDGVDDLIGLIRRRVEGLVRVVSEVFAEVTMVACRQEEQLTFPLGLRQAAEIVERMGF